MADAKKKKDLFEQWIEAGEVENKLGLVQSLSMQGQSMSQIADEIGVSRRTLQVLQKKYPALEKAISQGRQFVVAMCQNKLMERVSGGDTTAIIYALKVYGGDFFNDRKVVDAKVSGVPAAPATVQIYLPEPDKEVETHGEAQES